MAIFAGQCEKFVNRSDIQKETSIFILILAFRYEQIYLCNKSLLFHLAEFLTCSGSIFITLITIFNVYIQTASQELASFLLCSHSLAQFIFLSSIRKSQNLKVPRSMSCPTCGSPSQVTQIQPCRQDGIG